MPEAPKPSTPNYNQLVQKNKAILQFIEDVTTNAALVQRQVLSQILSQNSNSEYLTLYGRPSPDTFKTSIPLVSYDQIQPFVSRIANGDFSPILCSSPISEFLTRSNLGRDMMTLISFLFHFFGLWIINYDLMFWIFGFAALAPRVARES